MITSLTPGTGRVTAGYSVWTMFSGTYSMLVVNAVLSVRCIYQAEQGETGLNGYRAKQTKQDHRPQSIGDHLGGFFEHQAQQQHKHDGHAGCQAHIQEFGDKDVEIHTVTS